MKKTFWLMFFLVITTHAFSQQITSTPPLVKADYLKKSKDQKFIGWVFAGGGIVVAFITGISNVGVSFGSPKRPSPVVPFTISATLMAASIPFFIAASRNKKKANSLSFSLNSEYREFIRQGSFVRTSYPALVVKISL